MQPSVVHAADDGRDRRRAGALAHRSASPASATATLGSSASGNAPAPTLPIVSTTSHATPVAVRARAAARRRARAARRPARRAARASGSRERARRIAIERERRLERGERELVDAIRARERIPAHRVDASVASPRMSPACGPPSSLSPLITTIDAPAVERLARRRLAGQPDRRRADMSSPLPRSCRIGRPCVAATGASSRDARFGDEARARRSCCDAP